MCPTEKKITVETLLQWLYLYRATGRKFSKDPEDRERPVAMLYFGILNSCAINAIHKITTTTTKWELKFLRILTVHFHMRDISVPSRNLEVSFHPFL